jgi:hypothetical protein
LAGRKFDHIVLYDADSDQIPDNSPIALLGAKFARDKEWVGESTTMGWLKGGFKEFMERYGDLCEVVGVVPPSGTTFGTGTGVAGDLSSGLGTAAILTPALDKEMGVRGGLLGGSATASGLSAIPEATANSTTTGGLVNQGSDLFSILESPGSSARYIRPLSPPDLFNLQVLQSGSNIHAPPGTPPFLKDVIEGGDARGQLVGKWGVVEMEERRRLDLACRAKGPEDSFCVSVGLESGIKNRYSNIWPCK